MDEPAEGYVGAYLTSLDYPCLAASGLAAAAPKTDPPRGAAFGASLLKMFPPVAAVVPVAGFVAASAPKETLG